MLGRVRASPLSVECLELKRLPSKILKDDSISIYVTLMELKQGIDNRSLHSGKPSGKNLFQKMGISTLEPPITTLPTILTRSPPIAVRLTRLRSRYQLNMDCVRC